MAKRVQFMENLRNNVKNNDTSNKTCKESVVETKMCNKITLAVNNGDVRGLEDVLPNTSNVDESFLSDENLPMLYEEKVYHYLQTAENVSEVEDPFWNSDDSVRDPPYQASESSNSSDEDFDNDKNLASTKTAQPEVVVAIAAVENSEPLASTSNIEVKKRKGRTRKEREDSKRLRNSGKSYTSECGKFVPERKITALNSCRLKCSERFSEEDRFECFNDYWKLGTRDRRAMFLASLIAILPKKTQKTDIRSVNRDYYCKYELSINNEDKPVCKECFCKTFGETKGFVNVVIEKKKFSSIGIILPDERGRKAPRNKKTADEILTAKNHILSFPSYESHYCRKSTNKNYLSSDLSIAMMYRLYKENCSKPVSLKLYSQCFHELKLSFKTPSKDTCHRCDLLNTKIRLEDVTEEKSRLECELAEHQALAQKAYDEKKKDKSYAKSNTCVRVYTFDLQQCLPTPYLKTSVSFYKRQLWSFNLTSHDLATDSATCYMWDETIGARGANQIASCLYHLLLNLPPQVKEVTFYSDTCGGQNKNNIVAMMFMFLLHNHPTVEIINHKFLISGHSHMECDSDHAIIERTKKKTNMRINHLNDWIQLVRSCKIKNPFNVITMSLCDFYNFCDLSAKNGPFTIKKKDNSGDKFLWQPIQWLQYRKPAGEIHLKNTLDDDAPFKIVNYKKRGRSSIENVQLYNVTKEPLPITKEKKKDILDILPLIDPAFHDFYLNLKTNDEGQNRDPDLDEEDPDDENN